MRLTADIRRESLKEHFDDVAHEGVPFKIDVKPPSPVYANAMEDPSFRASFAHPKSGAILTDTSIAHLSDILEEAFPEETFDLKTAEDISEFSKQVEAIVKHENPELHASISKSIKVYLAKVDQKDLAELKTELSNSFGILPEEMSDNLLHDLTATYLLSEALTADGGYHAMPVHMSAKIDSVFSDRLSSGRYMNNGERIYVPDETLDISELMAQGRYADHIDLENIPGTPQEWAELIAYHELEHVAQDGQKALDMYAQEHGLSAQTKTLLSEIEADCGAFHALEDRISPEVLDHLVATRIVSGIYSAFDSSTDVNASANFTHETGFHLAEYHLTGEIPDFEHTQQSANGFYSTIYEKFDDHKDLLEEQGADTLASYEFSKDLPSLLGMVIEMRDAGEFTDPAQEQIAQHFIDNIQGTLGVEPNPNWKLEIVEEHKATPGAEPKVEQSVAPQVQEDNLNSAPATATM